MWARALRVIPRITKKDYVMGIALDVAGRRAGLF
jgi:hypothetical protein